MSESDQIDPDLLFVFYDDGRSFPPFLHCKNGDFASANETQRAVIVAGQSVTIVVRPNAKTASIAVNE